MDHNRLAPSSYHPGDHLERKMANQAAEIEQLMDDNRRLSSSLVVLKQDLVNIQQEIGGLHTHTHNIQKEGDIEIKGLLEKIGKMDVDLRVGESVKEDLLQAHKQAHDLAIANHEQTAKLREATEELKNFHANGKSIPEMHVELNNLRQECQKLHTTFVLEKGQNLKEVQEMEERERDIMGLVDKVEKLRAEVGNVRNKNGAAPSRSNPNYGPYSIHGVGPYESRRVRPQPRMNTRAAEVVPNGPPPPGAVGSSAWKDNDTWRMIAK